MDALKRNRSPNYPGVPLAEAVRRALALYEKTSGQEVNIEIAVGAFGFKSLSGASRQVLSAMSNYGLVTSKRGKVSTTSRTRMLKYKGIGSEEGMAELRAAILEAPLFAELWDKRLTPDEQLVFDLVEGMNFSDSGAKRAVQCFRDSLDFARLGTTHSEDPDIAGESTPGPPDYSADGPASGSPVPRLAHTFSWPLSPDLSVTVAFTGQPEPEDVEALCDYLEVMKRQLSRERTGLGC